MKTHLGLLNTILIVSKKILIVSFYFALPNIQVWKINGVITLPKLLFIVGHGWTAWEEAHHMRPSPVLLPETCSLTKFASLALSLGILFSVSVLQICKTVYWSTFQRMRGVWDTLSCGLRSFPATQILVGLKMHMNSPPFWSYFLFNPPTTFLLLLILSTLTFPSSHSALLFWNSRCWRLQVRSEIQLIVILSTALGSENKKEWQREERAQD